MILYTIILPLRFSSIAYLTDRQVLLGERLSIGNDDNQHFLGEVNDFLRGIAGERAELGSTGRKERLGSCAYQQVSVH